MSSSPFERVLILETSGRPCEIAVASGRQIVTLGTMAESRRRASDLTLVVRDVLARAGWKPADLSAVVVGLGPGSYTGLRVALASAKALVYATGCAFYGVESFAGLLAHVPAESTEVLIVSDALQGKLFVRRCRRIAGDFQPVGPITVESRSDMTASNAFVTGPAAEFLNATSRTSDAFGLLQAAHDYPWAIHRDAWTAEPLYVRGSSAEEKRKDAGMPV
jgi:tRNA threonylcarbamoyladenosine biosynthesis protein TsaB